MGCGIMILLIIIILLFLLLFFLPLEIKIDYKRQAEDDSFKLDVYPLLRLLGIRIRIPLIRSSLLKLLTEFWVKIDSLIFKIWPGHQVISLEKEINWRQLKLNKLKKIVGSAFDFKLSDLIFKTLKIKCQRMGWEIEFGWADPALTGISNGLIWAILGMLLRSLELKIDFVEEPLISVKPNFKQEILLLRFNGIFSVLIGNIILTVIRVMIYKIKGGSKKWANIQLKS